MPAGKRQQSNAMLYTLITFVALFIITTTFAVIYYIKAEKHRTTAANLQTQLNGLATSAELRNLPTLIGARQGRKSRLSTMVDYLDEMVYLILGGPSEETSAEVKVDTANRKFKDTLELIAQEHSDFEIDPNTNGLLRIIEKLKIKLDNTTNAELALKDQLEQLQNRFEDAMAASFEKEQSLLDEKGKYQQQITNIQADYNELKVLMKESSEKQVQDLMVQLDNVRAGNKELNQELLKAEAELKMFQERIKRCQDELNVLMPPPDSTVAAFKPDGKIILIDDGAKIVHLNIGSNDHVYRGLTFSVYDKSMPIPKDGRGKAEIEVFDVGENISAARITRSEIKRPIVLEDNVANLIWDSDKTNVFAVAGAFDLDSDGDIDYNAVDKIKALIEKWGGKAADTVSVNTDFLVLGSPPEVRQKPTFEQMEIDPLAMERYETSLQKLSHYMEAQSQAQALSIPVFNAERFLYFIGYKTLADEPGAF